jgi:hypothetical protein
MTNKPFNSPTVQPSVSSLLRPSEHLWSLRKDGVTWSAELRYCGEHGVEAQIFRHGEFVIGRRFDMRVVAVEWAETERCAIDAGL